MHLKNLAKVAQVVRKNKIDVGLQNTEQLVRRMVSAERPISGTRQHKQLHEMQSAVNKTAAELANKRKKVATEDELMESLDNIDMLLANMKAGASNKE